LQNTLKFHPGLLDVIAKEVVEILKHALVLIILKALSFHIIMAGNILDLCLFFVLVIEETYLH
jgi:hypothetical protein